MIRDITNALINHRNYNLINASHWMIMSVLLLGLPAVMRLKGDSRIERDLEALADRTCRSMGYAEHTAAGGIRMSTLIKAIRSNPTFREVFIV